MTIQLCAMTLALFSISFAVGRACAGWVASSIRRRGVAAPMEPR